MSKDYRCKHKIVGYIVHIEADDEKAAIDAAIDFVKEKVDSGNFDPDPRFDYENAENWSAELWAEYKKIQAEKKKRAQERLIQKKERQKAEQAAAEKEKKRREKQAAEVKALKEKEAERIAKAKKIHDQRQKDLEKSKQRRGIPSDA